MKKRRLHLSIVIPAYNEAGNIQKVVRESARQAKKITKNFEIIVCDDGSTDKTQSVLSELKVKIPHFSRKVRDSRGKQNLRLLVNKKNLGLGPTLLRLFKNAKGDFIQTLPGDFQMRPKEIPKFYQAIQKADLVCGWRPKRKDSFPRFLMSKIYNLMTQAMFGVKVHDLGSIKMIRQSALKKIKPRSKTNFIEAELVIKAYQKGLRVAEVPIDYYPRMHGQTTGSRPKVVFKIFLNLFKYFLFKKT